MASGDASRAWFREMLDILNERWHEKMSWEEMSSLCDDMQILRDRIRKHRNIKPVKILCKHCGHRGAVPPRISIRSLLFALKKERIISEDEFRVVDRSWKKYRRAHDLDAWGKKAGGRQ